MSNGTSSSDPSGIKTLWIGDLEPYMDEAYLTQLFSQTEMINVKVIRDKLSGNMLGYGFIEFASHEAAFRVLQAFSGQPIPNTGKYFRLNWGSFGTSTKTPERKDEEYSIFVGDLSQDVTDFMLLSFFQQRYSSTKAAKVITDPATNAPRGYGFVRFTNEDDMKRALVEMNGQFLSTRPMRISNATPKRTGAGATTAPAPLPAPAAAAPPANIDPTTDPANTTIFVGGLNSDVTEDDLRATFQQFGGLTYVKIPVGKGCGFVQFNQRSNAETALQYANGWPIGRSQCKMRLSWGRSMAALQASSRAGPTGTTPSGGNSPPALPSSNTWQRSQHTFVGGGGRSSGGGGGGGGGGAGPSAAAAAAAMAAAAAVAPNSDFATARRTLTEKAIAAAVAAAQEEELRRKAGLSLDFDADFTRPLDVSAANAKFLAYAGRFDRAMALAGGNPFSSLRSIFGVPPVHDLAACVDHAFGSSVSPSTAGF
eukprot:tig00021489_g21678.t1